MPSQFFRSTRVFYAVVILCALLAGCDKDDQQAGQGYVPEVAYSLVAKRSVPIWVDYPGTTKAVWSVELRARVEGFLQKRHFTEGDDVKKGDLLFTIDPREYEIDLEQARANVAKAKAAKDYADLKARRYQPLAKKEFASEDTYDEYRTQAREAHGDLMADVANRDQADLNLSYCYVYAPMDGRIGRAQVDEGNLVGAGGEMTVLAQLVTLDPIYVYFSPSEEHYQGIMRHKAPGPLQVKIKVPGYDTVKEYTGHVDFIDNTVNQETGTIQMRAVIANPDKTLLPGVYVTVNLFVLEAQNIPVIPLQASMKGQEGEFVYIVDDNSTIQERTINSLFSRGGSLILDKGLNEGEKVVIQGQKKVRPGMKVKAKEIAMPSWGENATNATGASAAPVTAASAPAPADKPSANDTNPDFPKPGTVTGNASS